MKKILKSAHAFTLIEILIAVLIIAMLVAIAIPQYQKAVLKSRFSTLMPVAKKVATAQEVYYLDNSYYAEDAETLDVESPAGVSVSLPNAQQYEAYNYVLAGHSAVPNAHYIIYQNQSANFPAEHHCEASKTDKQALWLCSKGLQGTRISGSLTPDYQTYVLQGAGKGLSYSIVNTMASVSCSESENSGNSSCTVDRSSSEYVVKTVCSKKTDPNTCINHVYDKEAIHWECYASKSKLVDGVCLPTAKAAYAYQYDEDGNRIELECDDYDTAADVCTQWATRTYNQLNTKVRADRVYCAQWDSNGQCTAYEQNKGYISFGTLNTRPDSFSNPHNDVPPKESGSLDYANSTTTWAQLNCAEVANDGTCASYKDGYYDTTTWDGNKKGTYFERMNCSEITPQGECAAVSKYETVDATNDSNGKQTSKIMRSCVTKNEEGNCRDGYSSTVTTYTDSGKTESQIYRTCLTEDAAGNCTAYKQNAKNENYQENYSYNANGKQTSYTRYRCGALDSATQCITYTNSFVQNNTYNDANKMLSEVKVGCVAFNDSNNCSQHDPQTNTYNTYAENGTTQTSQITTRCNSYTGLECTGGWTVTTTPYVNGKADNNHKVVNSNCSSVDMATGLCLDAA